MSGKPGDNSVVVRFVKTSKDAPVSSVFQEAFEAMQDISAESIWFDECECFDVNTKERKYIYLFEDFKGDAFERIVNTGNRIYGPVCVLHCLKNGVALPKEPFPVFSLTMQGCVVSCTGITKETREWIHKTVVWMSGQISKDFHQQVTHLVAGEVGSKKYQVAVKLKKKIMSAEWVEKIWDSAKTSFVKADDPAFDKYRCPLFKGFVITVSGLEEREYIKNIVIKEGGIYSGMMKVNECTHLVVNVPQGQKYEFAKQWKIHIVTPKWLTDSLDAGYCLDEQDYPVVDKTPADSDRRGHGTSTPTRLNSDRLSGTPDISAITTSHVNETNTTMTSNMSVVDGNNQTLKQNQTSRYRMSSSSNPYEGLEAIDLSKVKDDMFLDGCKVFLTGFKGTYLEKLKKMINIGGGTRLNHLTDHVTHVVMGEQVPSHVTQLQEASYRPHVVSVEWLIASWNAGESVSEEDFYCLDLPSLQPTTPKAKFAKSSRTRRLVSEKSDYVAPEAPPGGYMEDLLSQYLPDASTMGESTLMRAAEMGEDAANPDTSSAKLATPNNVNQNMSACLLLPPQAPSTLGNDTTIDHDATVDGGQCGLFGSRTFVILGFDRCNEQEIKGLIEEYGGCVLPMTTRKVPDFAVVPVFGCQVPMGVGDIVTNAWVQMCIEKEERLPLHSDPIFQPISITADTQPLAGCVISVSGYTGTERDAIVHMASVLGATVQEYFVKRANPANNLAMSSHLVVNTATGSKYNAAKKWNLPSVTKLWIVESAKQNKCLPADLFLVDRPPDPDPEPLAESNEHRHIPRLSVVANPTNQAENLPEPAAMETGEPGNNASMENNKINMDETMDNEVQFNARPSPQNQTRESQKENSIKASVSLAVTPGVADRNRKFSLMDTPVCYKMPLGGAQTSESTPKLVNHRVRELVAENRESPKLPKSVDTSWNGVDSPSVFLNPDRSFHAKFDLKDVMADLQSPATPRTPGGTKTKQKRSLDLGDVFTSNLDIAVRNQQKQKADGRQDSTPFSQRIRPVHEEEEEPSAPLCGVIIAVSKKLSTQQSEYNNIAASLGADYRWTYDRSCTHFIFQGRQNDMNREFRLAKDHGKIIVSPHWLNMCQEQNCRVDEQLFPHTFNPNLSLAITPAKATRKSARSRTLTRSSDKTPSPNPTSGIKDKAMFDSLNTTQSDEEIAQFAGAVEEKEEEHNTEALVKDLQNIMAATRTYSKSRRGNKRNDSFSKLTAQDVSGSGTRSRRLSSIKSDACSSPRVGRDRRPARTRPSRSEPETQTEASQMIEVSWDDPVAREQQQRLARDLAKNSESANEETGSSSRDHSLTNDEGTRNEKLSRLSAEHQSRIPTPEHPSLALPTPKRTSVSPPRIVELIRDGDDVQRAPHILISGMSAQERDDYGALVESLGGVMIASGQYDPRCTHLVVGVPSRNEKFLSAVAAGKWVLHKSYFEACRKAGRFVQEYEHEWGSDHTATIMKTMPLQTVRLAQAAHRWRHWFHEQNSQSLGVFHGWQVMLLGDRGKEKGFQRLLEAGSGKVVTTKYPCLNIDDITHAFIDVAKIKYEVNMEELVKAGIHCLAPGYIAAHIMDDPQPDPADHYLPEVLPFINKIGLEVRKRKASGTEPVSTPSSKRHRR